jgi:hypothetical protein
LSAAKRRKLEKEEEDAEAERNEQLKEERSLGKAAVKNQTKPRRNKGD